MKKSLFLVIVCYLGLSSIFNNVNSSQLTTPESFTQKVAFKPFVIEIIENKNVKEAVKQLDELNIKMFEEGWTLFQMIEYIDSGNFRGFIATYKKMDEKENLK